MTREEAIAILQEEMDGNLELTLSEWRERDEQKLFPAIRMAIKALQADAVQGEWKIDEYGIYHCPFCHAINNTVYKSFCPNCGARMENTK